GCGVPRSWLVTTDSGGLGNRSRGHYDPCCQELAARAPQEMAGPETRNRGRKSPGKERREARRPDRKGRRGASHAPRIAAYGDPTGASQAPGACRRSAHPSRGGYRFKTRARMRRGNELCCVFEYVLGCLTL